MEKMKHVRVSEECWKLLKHRAIDEGVTMKVMVERVLEWEEARLEREKALEKELEEGDEDEVEKVKGH